MSKSEHESEDFFLPPANEVWGKVIFSQACDSHSVHRGWGGALSRGCAGGVPSKGGVP